MLWGWVMFIQHKELKNLQVPAEKITHLHSAASSVQLAFAGYPPQLCRAYLLQISGGSKALIVVAFYLAESSRAIFFVPKYGELPVEDADSVYEEGHDFIESMGFVLNETDFHLLPVGKKVSFWSALPICQAPRAPRQANPVAVAPIDKELATLQLRSRKRLGSFFASM